MHPYDAHRRQQRIRDDLGLRFLHAYDEKNLMLLMTILQQADTDPELDAFLWDTFLAYLTEEEQDEGNSAPPSPAQESNTLREGHHSKSNEETNTESVPRSRSDTRHQWTRNRNRGACPGSLVQFLHDAYTGR